MAFFSIRNLSCSFGKNIILKNVSFDCEKNQAIALLGKSGSGKSTLLNCIANYVDYSGNIYINSKKGISFVFQDSYMIDYLSIEENIKLPSIIKDNKEKNIKRINDELGIKNINKNINEVSGGEKERIGIARALYVDSDLLLMDEPTGSLDSKNTKIISEIINKLKKDKLIIFATHDIEFAKSCADKILYIENKKVKEKDRVSRNNLIYNGQNQNKVDKKLSIKETLKLIIKMFKKRIGKTLLGIISLAVSISFILLILLININSNNVLDKIGDEYFNTNITKVSEIQKIKVDDNLNLIRNLRPNLDDNNDLKIEPSFDGILPSTISYSKDNKVNKVAFSPSVCDSSKLLLGKCPSRFNEVVINKNLEKNISEKDEIKIKKDIDFSINTGKNYAHDYISFDFALKIVGIAKESSLFNTQTIYYDYYEMQRYFELIKLENISKLFSKQVTIIDRITTMASNTDYITGYNIYVISDDLDCAFGLDANKYEIYNKSIEMKKSISSLISSLSKIANMFLFLASVLAIVLMLMFLINIFEEEKKTFGLIKSFGIGKIEFYKIPFATSVFISGLILSNTLLITTIVILLANKFINIEYLLYFIKISNPFYLILFLIICLFTFSILITVCLAKKIDSENLIDSLRGEEW